MNQIFKTNFPNEILFNFLDSVCIKTEKYYLLNNDSYKKGNFNGLNTPFLENCKPFYFLSKQKYLERTVTYNNLTTVIRQICNFNKIVYTSKIKYDKSTYSICYYIYF